MLKKTITFKDLDGKDLTEDFYFHLTKAEIAEMELSEKGGLTAYLEEIVKTEDAHELIQKFKEIILKTVGRRSEDGRRFIKTQEIRDDFMQTEAYSELFMELASDAEAAAKFMRALIPAGLEEQVDKELATRKTENVQLPDDQGKGESLEKPKTRSEIFEEKMKDPSWVPTMDDVKGLNSDQMARAFQRKQ